jgi:hypothetical protein
MQLALPGLRYEKASVRANCWTQMEAILGYDEFALGTSKCLDLGAIQFRLLQNGGAAQGRRR